MKIPTLYLWIVSVVVAIVLGACVDETVVEDTAEVSERCASSQDALLAVCPAGSTAFCNPSGDCRCCWPTGMRLCCRIETPYQRCNLSGDCRCSAT